MNKTQDGSRGNLRKYQSTNPLQRFLIQRFLGVVRKLVNKRPFGPLCEAGCGEGFVLKNLADRGLCQNRRVTGLELDAQALTFASANVPGASFVSGSVYQMPFENKEFECLLLLEVLEHLEQPERALSEAKRVSKSLIVSVPHEPFFCIANFLRGKNISRWGNDIEHIQHWNKKSFRKLLESYGAVIELHTPFPWLIAAVTFY